MITEPASEANSWRQLFKYNSKIMWHTMCKLYIFKDVYITDELLNYINS